MSGRRTIGNTFTVTTMDDPVSVVAQYSPDKSTIHTTFQAGDLYMRTRSTDSSTWSDWQKIVGESGDETSFTFNISALKTTSSATTAPSDISSWLDAPIATTTAKPYLWARVQKKSWDESTQAYVIDSTTYIRLSGESPIFCDLTNEISSVACNSSGVTTSEQSVATYAKVWLGSTQQTITAISCKVNGYTLYSSYQSDSSSPNYYYKYSATESTGYVIIYVRNGTTISSKTEVTITLTATINGTSQSQDIVLTINGVKAGAGGSSAVIYQLVPTYNEVVLKKDGTYAPTSGTYMTCSVSKNDGGTTSTPSSSEYTLKYILNGGSETTYSSTAVTAGSITSNLIFILYVNNVEVDRETIPLVSDGNKGYDAENYFIQTSVDNVTIPADSTSSTFSATANFYIKTGSETPTAASAYFAYYLRSGSTYTRKGYGGKNTSCTASDITATSSYDGLVFYIFSTYYTGSSPESQAYLAKKEIKFVKNGDNGDDGISYTFVFTEAYAKADINGLITGNIEGYAYKYEGGVRSALTSTTIRYGYILNDSDTYATATTDSNGYFDASNWFTGDYIDDYAKGSPSIFAAIIIDSTVVHVEYITISRQGETGNRGKVGRFYYYAGDFDSSDSSTSFVVTDAQSPYFYYNSNYWVYNPESNPSGGTTTMSAMGTPSSSSSNWKIMTSDFKYLITEAIFGSYAKFGSFVINGDWMISTNGRIDDTFYEDGADFTGTLVGGSTFTVKAYTLFDSTYPTGEGASVVAWTGEVTLSSSEYSKTITTAYLTSGVTYRLSVKGNSTSSVYPIKVQLYGSGAANLISLPYRSSGADLSAIFRVSSTGSYDIRLVTSTLGYTGTITICNITTIHFAPNYAVNGLTGTTIQHDGVFTGFVRKRKTKITTSNIDQYKRQDITSAIVLDFDKCGSFIELDTGTSSYITLPLLSKYYADKYTSTQKDQIRSYIGTTIIIYNNSGTSIPMTLRVNSDGSSTSGSLYNGNCVELECCIAADEDDGYEIVYWKVISYAEPV